MKILRLTRCHQAKPQMLRENLIAIHVPQSPMAKRCPMVTAILDSDQHKKRTSKAGCQLFKGFRKE
jgi:hypothetical protein